MVRSFLKDASAPAFAARPHGPERKPDMLIEIARSQLLIIDVQERLAAAMHDKDAMVQNCGRLLEAARLAGVPFTISEQYPEGLGETVAPLQEKAEGVVRLAKAEFSCIRNEPIRAALRAHSRPHLILCGIEAHVCVLQTAIEAKADGYDVFVAIDATASRRPESREIAIHRLTAAGVQVVTTEMVVFEWIGSAASPHFKALSKLIR